MVPSSSVRSYLPRILKRWASAPRRTASAIAFAGLIALSGLTAFGSGAPYQSIRTTPNITPDFWTTSELRDKTVGELDWGSPRTQLDGRIFVNDPAEIAEMFRKDEGGVMCQGAAHYLNVRYLRSGFDSYVLGFQNKYYSHSVVLVEIINEHGQKSLIIQDPTFNITYKNRTGSPLSIFDFMNLLSKGKHKDIFIERGSTRSVHFLQHPDDPDPSGAIYKNSYVGKSHNNPALDLYDMDISLESSAIALSSHIKEISNENGYDENILYILFDFPAYVNKGYLSKDGDLDSSRQLFDIIVRYYNRLHGRFPSSV